MKSDKIIPALFFVLALLAASFFIGKCSKNCEQIKPEEIIRIDTLIVFKEYAPDTFLIFKPRIVFRTDTLKDTTVIANLKDTAWTASDEVISSKSDTVRSEFLYPEMIFKHQFNYSRDSIRTITIQIEKIKMKERPWWEIPVSVIGGLVTGYVFGRVR